jgi:magnesium transporter
MGVIGAEVYANGAIVASDVTAAEAIAIAREQGGFAWIGLLRADRAELAELQDLLGLHSLAVADAQRGHRRALLETYGGDLFIALQPAHYLDDSESVVCAEIDLFVVENAIVTVHDDEVIDLDSARRELLAHPEVLTRGPLAVVWAVFELVLRRYEPVLAGVQNDIDEIQAQLFAEQTGVSHRIFALKREVLELQQATAPLTDMVARLRQVAAEHGAAPHAFRDVLDRARHVSDVVAGLTQTLDSALQVDATLSDQRVNLDMRRMAEIGLLQDEKVKKVSGWAAILFAPTLVGTVYGMNFENMPELGWAFGYPFALLLMVSTSVVLYVIFRRRDWL